MRIGDVYKRQEQNRLAILLAVLHRHGGLQMADQDVFVNVVGGERMGVERQAQIAERSDFTRNGFDNLLVKIAARFFAVERQPVADVYKRQLQACAQP